MATTKQPKPDWLKAKVRTARMSMDIDGTLDGALPDVFLMIGTRARREKVLKKITEVHESLNQKEDERREDIELAKIVESRRGEKAVPVNIEDL